MFYRLMAWFKRPTPNHLEQWLIAVNEIEMKYEQFVKPAIADLKWKATNTFNVANSQCNRLRYIEGRLQELEQAIHRLQGLQ